MKLTAFSITLLVLVASISAQGGVQTREPEHYTIDEETLLFSNVAEIDFQSEELDSASEIDKATYIRMQVYSREGEDLIELFNNDGVTLVQDFIFTPIDNPWIAENQKAAVMIKSRVSHDAIHAYLNLKISTFDGIPYDSFEISNSQYMEFPATWVNESLDWKSTANTITNIIKVIIYIIAILTVIVRPFMPEYFQTKSGWMLQTAILFQITIYNALTPSFFGGIIDEIHAGQLQASQQFFFADFEPGFAENTWYVNHKYFQNSIIPSVFEEIPFFTFLTLAFNILTWIVGTTSSSTGKTTNILRALRQATSAISLLSFVPLMAILPYAVINLSASTDRTGFAILDCFCGSIALLFVFIHLANSVSGVHQIAYLHRTNFYNDSTQIVSEQTVDGAFDTYPNLNSSPAITACYWISIFVFTLTWSLGYLFEWGSIFIAFICSVCLFLLVGKRYGDIDVKTNNRLEHRPVVLLTLLAIGCLVLKQLVYFIFGVGNLSLNGVKVFTSLFIVLYAIYLLFLLAAFVTGLASTFSAPKFKKTWKAVYDIQKSNGKAK